MDKNSEDPLGFHGFYPIKKNQQNTKQQKVQEKDYEANTWALN